MLFMFLIYLMLNVLNIINVICFVVDVIQVRKKLDLKIVRILFFCYRKYLINVISYVDFNIVFL